MEIATKQIGDKVSEGIAYSKVGLYYYAHAEYGKAIESHEKHLKLAEIGNNEDEEIAYANLGVCYYFLGKYNEAIASFEKQLKIAKQIGDILGEGNAWKFLYVLGTVLQGQRVS